MSADDVRWLEAPLNWLELNGARLCHNLAGVRRLVGRAQIMAVLKANAYGAGAVGMAQKLAAEGIRLFGVATVAEGVELRAHGIAGDIVCLAHFTRDEIPAIFTSALTPTVYSATAGRLLSAHAIRHGQKSAGPKPVWVKVDTGLGRLGVPHHLAADFLREVGRLAGLKIGALFSTLTENPARDPVQVQRLLDLRRALPELAHVPVSMASSHGILSLPTSYGDIVRSGIMLHGVAPSERERLDPALVRQADLQPIATWKARIAEIKMAAAGEQIGYGLRPALAQCAPLAVLTVGWADGYPAGMSDGGSVLVGGVRCPVLAVSANSTIVDIGNVPQVAINDEAVLLGQQGNAEIAIGELAQITGGSVYRLLAVVPREVPRIWV